jgi:hypothetical protein
MGQGIFMIYYFKECFPFKNEKSLFVFSDLKLTPNNRENIPEGANKFWL